MNKNKGTYIIKIPRDHERFRRPMIITDSFNNVVAEIKKPVDENNEIIIVCDGCNRIIETPFILCLSFKKGHIHSAECQGCVDKYFSDLPIKEYDGLFIL